jgi:hypothetical protein
MRMSRRSFLAVAAAAPVRHAVAEEFVLRADSFRHHVEFFNAMVPEDAAQFIPDAQAWSWMRSNIPLFTCPDRDLEQIYYYRWWVFRKHIRRTPAGFIITEFLKPVKHAGEDNSLSCAFGHHVAEARWLHDRRFLDDYVHFWLRGGPNGGLRPNFHQFSGWAAAALYDRRLADGGEPALISYLDALVTDFRAWETERGLPDGLFWQRDVADGMEESISGGRREQNARPSINSYMYGNARALAVIAQAAGRDDLAREFAAKAARLRTLVQERLWNPQAAFFETVLESGRFAAVREEIGFTPWMFTLPEPGKGYAAAWKQLLDAQGFYAPFGPTTAERRHPAFRIADEGDDCQWNGPAWPFATTITLKALANLLQGRRQEYVSRSDYFKTFKIYTRCQHRKLPDGSVIPWIDENLNPLTGEWQARAMKIRKGTFYGRGDHYNHSGYCDLVITGLAGLRPRAGDTVEISPLLPANTWDWFCLDRLPYHGRMLTILWDKSGRKFGKGAGLHLFADGREIAHSAELASLTGRLA